MKMFSWNVQNIGLLSGFVRFIDEEFETLQLLLLLVSQSLKFW